MTLVTHFYRPKRARNKKSAVSLAGPRIVTVRRAAHPTEAEQPAPSRVEHEVSEQRPVIVAARNPRRGRFGDVPDMTPEEHQQRGDAAEALFRELTRRV